MLSMAVIVMIFGGGVFAEVRVGDSATLYRGGSSVIFPKARKDTVYGVDWCSNLTYIHAFGGGFPAGLIGSNRIISRMRTNETEAKASDIITHGYWNYTYQPDAEIPNNRVYQSFYSGYGSYHEYYKMAVSMSSVSSHSSSFVSYRWNP